MHTRLIASFLLDNLVL